MNDTAPSAVAPATLRKTAPGRLMTPELPPRYTDTKAYEDLQAALVAIGRHVKLSGNKKLIYHLLVLESFRDVAVKVLDQTDPEVLRAAARDFEIKARLALLE